MSITRAILERLMEDLHGRIYTHKKRKHFKKYWISKESAEMAERLSTQIDKTLEQFHARNHNRNLRPSKRQKDNV